MFTVFLQEILRPYQLYSKRAVTYCKRMGQDFESPNSIKFINSKIKFLETLYQYIVMVGEVKVSINVSQFRPFLPCSLSLITEMRR